MDNDPLDPAELNGTDDPYDADNVCRVPRDRTVILHVYHLVVVVVILCLLASLWLVV